MKICAKCGAFNSDNRSFCIDCGKKLGKAVSSLEEEKALSAVNENLTRLENKYDPLYVNLFDKIVGIFSLILALITFIYIIVSFFIGEKTGILWFSLIAFILASLEALFPEIMWAIEKVRLSLYTSDIEDALPGRFYYYSKKAVVIVLLLGGIILFAINAGGYLNV